MINVILALLLVLTSLTALVFGVKQFTGPESRDSKLRLFRGLALLIVGATGFFATVWAAASGWTPM